MQAVNKGGQDLGDLVWNSWLFLLLGNNILSTCLYYIKTQDI